MHKMTRAQIREHIFKLLFRVEFISMDEMPEQIARYMENPPTNNEEDIAEEPIDIPAADALYITQKYDKIVAMIPKLDELIDSAAKGWKAARLGKVDLTILRLAVYEMKYDEDIPVGVAINEAVELAKKFGQDESPSFINGILAKLAKQTDNE